MSLNEKGGVKSDEFYCQGASYNISSSSSKPGNANGLSMDTSAASASSTRRTGAVARQTVSKFTFAAFSQVWAPSYTNLDRAFNSTQ